MQKKLIIAIVVILVIIAGVFFVTSSSDDSNSDQSQNNEQNSPETGLQQTTVSQLASSGDDLECSYDYTDSSDTRNVGTLYFSNGNMSGNFTATESSGQEFQANVLLVSNVQYVWEDGSTDGYKIDLSAFDSSDDDSSDDSGFNPDEEINFNCQSWSADQSMFEAPGNVNFVDNSALIQNATENLSSVCASIPDTAQRTACEESL